VPSNDVFRMLNEASIPVAKDALARGQPVKTRYKRATKGLSSPAIGETYFAVFTLGRKTGVQ